MEVYKDRLEHSGIKGMRWGVRRYQNKDGTLTDLGKKRYARDAKEKEYDKYDESTRTYYKSSKKNGRTDLSVDTDRYVKEDLSRTKRLTDESSNMVNKFNDLNNKAIRNTKRTRMDLSKMSDKEMRDQINRELLERQYNDVFNPQKVSKGREYTKKTLEAVGTAITLTGSALSVALAIKELRG